MKFGTQLNSTLYPDWRFYYIDYDGLKRLIKPKVSDIIGKDSSKASSSASPNKDFDERDEAKFVEFLEKDLEKVSSFQKIKFDEISRRIQHGEEVINKLVKQQSSNKTDLNKEFQEAEAEVNRILIEVNALASFSRMNYTGFIKIIKKHDKHTGYALKPMFMVRLNSKPFFHQDFDGMLIKLSQLYALVRNKDPHHQANHKRGSLEAMITANHRECRTLKYWVHPDNVMEVKLRILRHLPVLLYGAQSLTSAGGKVDPRINSVYLDNDNLEVYTDRVEKRDEAPTYCLTWFGANDTGEIVIERKLHREITTTKDGEAHTKQQVKIKEKYIAKFLMGDTSVLVRMFNKLRSKQNLSETKIDDMEQLAYSIQEDIVQKNLQPTLRTFYNRMAFQMPSDSAPVRITLDTEVSMIREDNFDQAGRRPNPQIDWRRRDMGPNYPFANLPKQDINRFPHAILEIKTNQPQHQQLPSWVDDLLLSSHLVQPVNNFSKYVHGIATLLESRVSVLPFWLPLMDQDLRRNTNVPDTDAEAHNDYDDNNYGTRLRLGSFPNTEVRFAAMAREASRQSNSSDTLNLSGSFKKKMITKSKLSASNDEVRIDIDPQHNERTPLLATTTNSNATTLRGGENNIMANFMANFNRPSTTTANRQAPPPKRISVPVRVEPKVYFANERTFLSWLHFSLTLGGMSLSLLNFGVGDAVAQLAGLVFLSISLLTMAYALFTFQWRAQLIRTRQPGPYDDRVGPIILVGVVFAGVMINVLLKLPTIMVGLIQLLRL